GIPTFRSTGSQVLAAIPEMPAIQSAHHVASGHDLSQRGAAEVGASIATGRHRNGFSGSAHDHRAPGPPLGDGRDGLNTEMSERLYRYQRSALPPMAILAGPGDRARRGRATTVRQLVAAC